MKLYPNIWTTKKWKKNVFLFIPFYFRIPSRVATREPPQAAREPPLVARELPVAAARSISRSAERERSFESGLPRWTKRDIQTNLNTDRQTER